MREAMNEAMDETLDEPRYEIEQLIGGEWGVGGTAGHFDVLDPADGQLVTRAPVASEGDVDAAV
jgi:succinate-semialdehyde dehydrogenase/glutarate-semialdehyde dehydrogenase